MGIIQRNSTALAAKVNLFVCTVYKRTGKTALYQIFWARFLAYENIQRATKS